MLQEFWGKSRGLDRPYPLLAHLLDTATIGLALWDRWLRQGLRDRLVAELGNDARELCAWAVGVHDIGKANPGFQYRGTENASHGGVVYDNLRNSTSIQWIEDVSTLAGKNDWKNGQLQYHQFMSAWSLNGGCFPDVLSPVSGQWAAIVALGHHGQFESVRKRPMENRVINRWLKPYGWLDVQKELSELVALGLGIIPSELPKISSTSTILLSGLTVLADRLASDKRWVIEGQALSDVGEINLDSARRWIEARYISAVSYIDRTVGIYRGWADETQAKEAILGQHRPRDLQKQATQLDAQFMLMNAMTGSGKTEAALLRHAQREERLIFLLPTQATTNAIMRRVHRAYASTSNVASLAHGLASIEEFYAHPVTVGADDRAEEGLYPTEFVTTGAQRLLAPVCVGTVDQALTATLPLKWTHLRLLGLANAHVVIDEVHTMDDYQSALLQSLLKWLAAVGARVTLLSATMSKQRRDGLVKSFRAPRLTVDVACESTLPDPQFPSIESLDGPSAPLEIHQLRADKRNIGVDLSCVEVTQDSTGHVEWFLRQRQVFPHARIGVICNVVARAQDVARRLTETGEQVLLLHARMTAQHRARVARDLESTLGPNSDAQGISVVGTQAIEASLDIDLDFLSTDLCPAPSLIQRAGRAWRRDDSTRQLRIPGETGLRLRIQHLLKAEQWQLWPYFKKELSLVYEWLVEHHEIVLPGSSQGFLDSTAVSSESLSADNFSEETADQVANQLRKSQSAKDVMYSMENLLSVEATPANFTEMTNYANSDISLEDLPTTRFVEQSSYNVIVLGDSELIPGAWDGSPGELVKLRGKEDQATLKRVLQASMPLGANIKSRGALLQPLSEAKSVLSRYFTLDLRGTETEFYDPVLGFVTPRRA